MDSGLVEFTGLYNQKVTLRARDIVHVIAHRVWTEVMVIGGTTYKVLESGDEVDALVKAALQPERTETPETDGAGTAENADTTGTEDADCTGKDVCDIPGTEEAKA